MKEIIVYADGSLPPFRSSQDMADAVASGRAEIASSRDVAPLPRPATPSLLQKAANFATSTARHVAAGMPQCTQEQIDARFTICQGCQFFDGRACTKYECPVVREKAFVSKLSWASEKCPAGKWGPVDASDTVVSERTADDGNAGPSLPPQR